MFAAAEDQKLIVKGLEGYLAEFNGVFKQIPNLVHDNKAVWANVNPFEPSRSCMFYIYRDADEHWWAMGSSRDVEENTGDVTSEETGQASPVNLTYDSDYGKPTVQRAMVTATAAAATNIATGKVRASGGGVHDSCKGKGKAKALASASHGMEMLAYSDNDSPQQGTCSRSDSAKGSDKGKGKAKAAASSPSSHGSVSSPKMSTLGSENAKAIAAELPTDDDNAEEAVLLEHVQEAFPDHQTKLLFEKVFDSGSIEDRIDKVITYCTERNSADAAKLLKSIKDGSRRSTAILPGKNTEAILLDCVFVTNEIGDPRQSDPDGRGCLARIAIPKGTLVWDNAVQWRKCKVPRHLEGTGNYVKYADGFFLLHKTAPPQPFKATSFFLNEARDSNKLPAQRQPNIKWQIIYNTHTSTKAFYWRFLKDVKADEEIVCAYDQDFAGGDRGRKNKDRMSPKVTISDKENAKQSGNSNSKNTNTSTNMSTSAGSSNSNSNKKKKLGAPSKAVYVRKISDDDAQWVRYASCSKAAQQVGVSNCNISNCCHGKIKEAGGYEFTFMPSSLSNASGSGSGNGNSVSANTNTSTNMSERTDDELSESMEDSEESNEVINLCSSSESEEEEGEGSGDNQRKMEAADYQASIPEQNCSGEDVERPRKRIRPSFQ